MIIDQIYYPPGKTGNHFRSIDNVFLNKLLKSYYDNTKPCFFLVYFLV